MLQQIDVVKAIQDQAEMSQDPATKCRSRSRSMASLLSGPQGQLLRRKSSSQTVDIPFADSDSTDNILTGILEEQDDRDSSRPSNK